MIYDDEQNSIQAIQKKGKGKCQLQKIERLKSSLKNNHEEVLELEKYGHSLKKCDELRREKLSFKTGACGFVVTFMTSGFVLFFR